MSTLSIFALSYGAIALVFAAVLTLAFLKDGSTPKTDPTSWMVVIVGGLLWAIALPAVLYQRTVRYSRYQLFKYSPGLIAPQAPQG